MAFAPIEAIKDLLTGSIWDKFKEMIEPYALVSSIIFISLNLALIYPSMGGLASNPFFVAFGKASDPWKLAAGTITLFVVSYLINHLGGFILDFASGEAFRRWPLIGKWLANIQENKFLKLQADSTENETSDDDELKLKRGKATFRLAYDYPVRKEELGLTKLGNLLLSPSSYVAHQYGTSLHLVWPIIQTKLKDDNKIYKSAQTNWTSLLFFTSLFGVLILIALELVLLLILGGAKPDIAQIITLLFFAYVCLYASLDKSRQWGRAIRYLFDVHAREVFVDLGMEGLKDLKPADIDQYRSRWQEVLGWLAYGAIRENQFPPDKKWYTADSPAPEPEKWPQVKHPDILKVESMKQFTGREMYSKNNGRSHLCIEKTVDYFFAVTNISSGEKPLSARDAYLLVQDAGVSPPQAVVGKTGKQKTSKGVAILEETNVTGKRQEGKPPGLLFPLGTIQPGASRVLTYSLDSTLASVTINPKVKSVTPGKNTVENIVVRYIDIIPENWRKNTGVKLTVKALDDSQSKLNVFLNMYAENVLLKKVPGALSEDKRECTWIFSAPENVDRVRVWFARTMKGG